MKLDADRFSGWRRGKVNPKKFADWAEHAYADCDETPSVATLLDRYASWLDPADHEYLRLAVKGATVTIEGTLQESSFNEMAGLVGGLWRSAARFGGNGELVFTGVGIDLEDRVLINGVSSRFVTKHKKSKINEKTTPEEAQETVWLHVSNDSMTAARRVVGEYLAAKGPIVPAIAFEFLSAFDDAVAKAGPVVDAITAAIERELEVDDVRTWRDVKIKEGDPLEAFKSDFFGKLLWTLNEMGREKQCRELFERWRDGGGAVTLSNYGRYFYALSKLRASAQAGPALDAFEKLWAEIEPNARASGEAGAIFVNAACAAAMIDDRERMLKLLRLAVKHKYSRAKIADDDDFAAFRKDPAFVKIARGA